MFSSVYDRIKRLSNKIRELEDKLMNTYFLPVAEQNKMHAEIRKCKEELDVLERQTRSK